MSSLIQVSIQVLLPQRGLPRTADLKRPHCPIAAFSLTVLFFLKAFSLSGIKFYIYLFIYS